MSQRNPMNERYQREDHQGATRKSAASAKPKSKAAASVYVKPKEKTKQQKKAEQKVAREKQAELDRKYYNPKTAEYKKWRGVWWALLIIAIIAVIVSWAGPQFMPWLPAQASVVTLVIAWVCIIGGLVLDLTKIRKIRRSYQEEMARNKSKAQRAAEKQLKAEEKARQAAIAKGEVEEPKKKGLFGFGKKK